MHNVLERKVERIEKVVETQKITGTRLDEDDIENYYRWNSLPYKLFHSSDGYIHMGISYDGEFTREDLHEIPRKISEHIGNSTETAVLELGAGKGVNTEYLAEEFNKPSLFTLDLSEKNVSDAEKRLKPFNNCKVSQGNYHNLSGYGEDSFDLVFIVEALCYSENVEKVFSEVERVLKPEGKFIVVDGYLNTEKSRLSETERKAQELLEKGMALENFTVYSDFKEKSANQGFEISEEEELSNEIIPTAERFEKLAEHYYNHPTIARIIKRVLPKAFVYNSLSGYLMKDLVKKGVDTYYFTVFEKNNSI